MTTTWSSAILISLGVIGVAGFAFWKRIERWLDPVPKPVPGREAAGADEKFPGELRALRDAPVAPELVTDTEMDLQWGLIWHDCEHRWQAEVARIFAEAQAELERPRTFDEVRELVAA